MGAQESALKGSDTDFWRQELGNSADDSKFEKLYEFAQLHPEFDLNFMYCTHGKQCSLLHALATDDRHLELLQKFLSLEEADSSRLKLNVNLCVKAAPGVCAFGMCTPLMVSAFSGSCAIAAELLKRNPYLLAPGCHTTALKIAANGGNDTMVNIVRSHWQRVYCDSFKDDVTKKVTAILSNPFAKAASAHAAGQNPFATHPYLIEIPYPRQLH
jgi:hypothetical protein